MTPTELFERHMPAALSIAGSIARNSHRLAVSGVEVEDVEQGSLFGLWYACRRFDPARADKFAAYAALCAKGFALRTLRRSFDMTRRERASGVNPATIDQRTEAPVFDAVVRSDLSSFVRSVVDSDALTVRERVVVSLRVDDCTLEEIGWMFDVSRERIRQIEAKAHGKLERLLRREAA